MSAAFRSWSGRCDRAAGAPADPGVSPGCSKVAGRSCSAFQMGLEGRKRAGSTLPCSARSWKPRAVLLPLAHPLRKPLREPMPDRLKGYLPGSLDTTSARVIFLLLAGSVRLVGSPSPRRRPSSSSPRSEPSLAAATAVSQTCARCCCRYALFPVDRRCRARFLRRSRGLTIIKKFSYSSSASCLAERAGRNAWICRTVFVAATLSSWSVIPDHQKSGTRFAPPDFRIHGAVDDLSRSLMLALVALAAYCACSDCAGGVVDTGRAVMVCRDLPCHRQGSAVLAHRSVFVVLLLQRPGAHWSLILVPALYLVSPARFRPALSRRWHADDPQ